MVQAPGRIEGVQESSIHDPLHPVQGGPDGGQAAIEQGLGGRGVPPVEEPSARLTALLDEVDVLLAMDHEQILLRGRMGLVYDGALTEDAHALQQLPGLPVAVRLPGVVLPEVVLGELLVVQEGAMVPGHRSHLKVRLI